MKIYWNGERKNVIGSRVKELRKKQDISQKILAARLSLSGTTNFFPFLVKKSSCEFLKRSKSLLIQRNLEQMPALHRLKGI